QISLAALLTLGLAAPVLRADSAPANGGTTTTAPAKDKAMKHSHKSGRKHRHAKKAEGGSASTTPSNTSKQEDSMKSSILSLAAILALGSGLYADGPAPAPANTPNPAVAQDKAAVKQDADKLKADRETRNEAQKKVDEDRKERKEAVEQLKADKKSGDA